MKNAIILAVNQTDLHHSPMKSLKAYFALKVMF